MSSLVEVIVKFEGNTSRAGTHFWNHVINFKDVSKISGTAGVWEVVITPKDHSKIAMRIEQVKAFAKDMGVKEA